MYFVDHYYFQNNAFDPCHPLAKIEQPFTYFLIIMKDQLLLCHGHLHAAKKPRYIHRKFRIDFKNAIHLDMNLLSIPDICCDLTDASTIDKVPANTFNVIIPIYADYHIYGDSWQDKPNQVLIDVALKSLKIGGTILMCPASNFFVEDDGIDLLVKGLKHRFPLTLCHNFYVVIEAFQRTRYDQKERDIVKEQLLKCFADIGIALSYLENNIPVSRKCKIRRIAYQDKLEFFSNSVMLASGSRLCLVKDNDAFIKKDFIESCIVFKKLS